MGDPTKFNSALALEREGRFVDAFALFQQCLSDPTFDTGDLCFHCGFCLENEGKVHQALVWYRKAIEHTHIPATKLLSYFRSGWVLMQHSKLENAADFFLYAVDYGFLMEISDATHSHAAYCYAQCLEALGQYVDALKWYAWVRGQSAALEPEGRFRQIRCLVRLGSYDEALRMCWTFESPAPAGLPRERYFELAAKARVIRAQVESLHLSRAA